MGLQFANMVTTISPKFLLAYTYTGMVFVQLKMFFKGLGLKKGRWFPIAPIFFRPLGPYSNPGNLVPIMGNR